ncbi:class I SAM-dependent methyltransferase [Telluribacter sp. SYSU D00476]|uniref:class I SAM-dependent methyltransferase n=1 Tax=Telluribacter sp. SYSU D00476 TaxID=2811430 RepID=UPI001FF5FD04|nr:class I SAM-dependent methyltransferase [Telluribacter sp. SYSU D00476]
MKDLFSEQAAHYAQYRPTYPTALVEELASLAPARHTAWDCGTGNGQLAVLLSENFDKVIATDISAQQLLEAPQKHNITYLVEPAERTSAPDSTFDLVTVAQAIHWFSFEKFYGEVNRVLRPGGLLAVIGYGLCRVAPDIDPIIDYFYTHTVGPYWDAERRYLDEEYVTIPFPYKEINLMGAYKIQYDWSLPTFTNYLRTWSAVRHFQRVKQYDPVAGLEEMLVPYWIEGVRSVEFPLLLRIGSREEV